MTSIQVEHLISLAQCEVAASHTKEQTRMRNEMLFGLHHNLFKWFFVLRLVDESKGCCVQIPQELDLGLRLVEFAEECEHLSAWIIPHIVLFVKFPESQEDAEKQFEFWWRQFFQVDVSIFI